MNDTAHTPVSSRPTGKTRRKLIRCCVGLLLVLIAMIGTAIFKPSLLVRIGLMPLVFNESFFDHQYCIKQIGTALRIYASDNNDVFPAHPGGYGDALLLLYTTGGNYIVMSQLLTGPCYDWKVFDNAIRTNGHVPESECGRVYVQGLKEESHNLNIALLWDKQPTRGGDHWHGWSKLRAPLLREVCLLDGSTQKVLEKDWPEFSKKQIELLVAAGIPRERAVALYAEKPKFKA